MPSCRMSSWSVRRMTSSPCAWPSSTERSSSWQMPRVSANRPIALAPYSSYVTS